MLYYQEQAVKEAEQLGDKIENIKDFMLSQIFLSFSEEEQKLYYLQLASMKAYKMFLDERIKMYRNKKVAKNILT